MLMVVARIAENQRTRLFSTIPEVSIDELSFHATTLPFLKALARSAKASSRKKRRSPERLGSCETSLPISPGSRRDTGHTLNKSLRLSEKRPLMAAVYCAEWGHAVIFLTLNLDLFVVRFADNIAGLVSINSIVSELATLLI
ncbi:hypothetical protein KCU73_g44, partial [Aureobasidium melanogenum]